MSALAKSAKKQLKHLFLYEAILMVSYIIFPNHRINSSAQFSLAGDFRRQCKS